MVAIGILQPRHVMETLIIHAEKEKIDTITEFLKKLNISFEKKQELEAYNQEFVERVLMAENEIKQGKGVRIPLDELWK